MTGAQPACIEAVALDRRTYPPSWRDAAIRALIDVRTAGVTCPRCDRLFRGRAALRNLHCDHIVPFSRGGRTTWQNLQLLCGPCNWEKNNRVEMIPVAAASDDRL
jgi:5-methylcytosine-specific restriction endonuclease McrA